jgi:hypothetical protein
MVIIKDWVENEVKRVEKGAICAALALSEPSPPQKKMIRVCSYRRRKKMGSAEIVGQVSCLITVSLAVALA